MKISILVPFYNAAQDIERCARSLFGQTYPFIEYVFVDNNSQDGGCDILLRVLEEFPERKSSFQLIKHKENQGLSASRNHAIEHATGEFVYFVDSDDWIEFDCIDLLVRRQHETNADIVTANYKRYESDGVHQVEMPQFSTWNEMMMHHLRLLPGRELFLWNRLIRRSIFMEYSLRELEGYDYAEDLRLVKILMYYTKRFSYLECFTYHYNRGNEDSVTNNFLRKMTKKLILLEVFNIDDVIRFYADKEPCFYQEAVVMKLFFLCDRLKKALRVSSYEIYQTCLTLLDASSPCYWEKVGWNQGFLRRFVYHHYLFAKWNRRLLDLRKKWNLRCG